MKRFRLIGADKANDYLNIVNEQTYLMRISMLERNLLFIKFLLHLFFLFSVLGVFSQTDTGAINGRIKELMEKSCQHSITQAEKDELHNYGYSIQNKAFSLEEQKHDYTNALRHTNDAISFWISVNDEVNEANLRKYKGMLLGRLKRFDEGKQEIRRAIEMYKKLNKDYGVAVSQYDMSRILDLEGRLDSALFYQIKASSFWTEKKDPRRITVNNTHLIHLFCRLKRYEEASKIQASNALTMSKNEHWNPVINFYYVSYVLFKETGDTEKANLWKMRYDSKIEVLKSQGIATKSIYDGD